MQFNTPNPLQSVVGSDNGGIKFGTTPHRHPRSEFQCPPGRHTTLWIGCGRTNIPDCADTTQYGRPSRRNDGERPRGRHPHTHTVVRPKLLVPGWCLPPQVGHEGVAEELLQDAGWWSRRSLRLVPVPRRRLLLSFGKFNATEECSKHYK